MSDNIQDIQGLAANGNCGLYLELRQPLILEKPVLPTLIGSSAFQPGRQESTEVTGCEPDTDRYIRSSAVIEDMHQIGRKGVGKGRLYRESLAICYM